MKIKVTITKEIMNYCLLESAYRHKVMPEYNIDTRCPIAVSLKEMFGSRAYVGSEGVQIFLNAVKREGVALDYYIENTEELYNFIKKFDRASVQERKEMVGFSFYLNIPNSVLKLLGGKETERRIKTSKFLTVVES